MADFYDQSPGARYDYANPVALPCRLEPLIGDLIGTTAFFRLKDVRFLGGIDYLVVPAPNGAPSNIRYTRYQHSLGVARLALAYSDLTGLSERNRQLAIAAALLHDIGHAPLSHSLEPVFEEEFGVNHHQATKDIITGEAPFGKEVHRTLQAYRLDPDQVLAVIGGEDDPFDGFFAGPINFDTIEAILRARRYLKASVSCPDPIAVVCAAVKRETHHDQRLIDAFWNYKHEVYRFLIRSREGVLTDYLCQSIARDNLSILSKKDFFISETALFRKLPNIRGALRGWRFGRQAGQSEALSVSYKMRNFFINTEADFFARNDKMRYRQTKVDKVLTSPDDGTVL